MVLGGAGFESETVGYATVLAAEFERAGLPGPAEYVPISSGGQPGNIATTLWLRGSPSDSTIADQAARAFAPDAESRNVVGYSYGSVVGAQLALDLADQGTPIDAVVLIGSPIAPDSELATSLESHPDIGAVIWVDIPGDPFSGGINPAELSDMNRHFVFIGQPETGAPDARQTELATEVIEAIRSNPDGNTRLDLPSDFNDTTRDTFDHEGLEAIRRSLESPAPGDEVFRRLLGP